MRHTKSVACLVALLSATGWAIQPAAPATQSRIASKAFFKPDLYLPTTNMSWSEAQPQLSAQSTGAWADFFARNGGAFNVYLDPRFGTATGVQGSIPLIPGSGMGNTVSLSSVSQALGRPVSQVSEAVVADLIVKLVSEHQAALGVDALQLGEPRVKQVAGHLWQVHIPQQVDGVPVRHGRVVATLSHGNLILLGTEAWGNVRLASTKPTLTEVDAMAVGSDYVGLYSSPGALWLQPALELIPFVRTEAQKGDTFVGAFGAGYGHRLAWTYGFQLPGELERWKVSVDAQTGEVLAVQDENHYLDASIKGGVYPSTNIEVCSAPETCGTMQPDSPMPWANTGLAAPDNFTDGAGVFNYTSGTATTTLAGRYVRINDNCGAVSFSSSTGDMNLGGTNGNHDCTSGGGSSGNTASARSCFYEINKLAELARGWIPSNTWLQSQLTANVNINSTCNAFWNGSTINFYRSGGGCRNTGEIGAVFDHEWGHGIDDFDANGTLSSSSEGYADIAAIYRLQTSCVGYGFWHTADRGCGPTPDGTGFNQNESQVSGQPWCNTRCSGVRDADWAASVPNVPATPQNFVCSRCNSGPGPCGRQVHCSASPTRQAAWDLVARDLLAAPFNYDSNTAFIIGNKLFYQGSGNVGTWHACDCTAGTSNGCGATNGYMQWLAADDDNGNLADGTPHMSAIYAAFNRHNIACTTPAPVTAGCSGGPSTAPSASVSGGDGQVALSWSAVGGASQYWVMKTEGFAGCNFSKARVATVTGTSYTDGEVANGRQYCYSIVAASSEACFSPASACRCATPTCAPPGVPGLVSPAEGATGLPLTSTVLDWSDLQRGGSYDVEVATDSAFTNVVRSASGLPVSTWTVSPGLAVETRYYWRVRAINSCGGTSSWSAPRSFRTRPCIALAAPSLLSPLNGLSTAPLSPSLDWSDVTDATSHEVQVAADTAFTHIVRSASGLAASNWSVSPPLSPNTRYYWRARAADSCGGGAFSSGFGITTANVCTLPTASFNAALRVPACNAACGCDTGSLVSGRANISGGPEANQPNTLQGACADGTSGVFHRDESIDRIVLKTVDEGLLTPNKQVRAEVTVWCYGTSDKLDLYYTTSVSSPSWTPLVTSLSCGGSGARTFTHTFIIGSSLGQHALRAQFRSSGLSGPCSPGNYNERDDMVFTVSSSTELLPEEESELPPEL